MKTSWCYFPINILFRGGGGFWFLMNINWCYHAIQLLFRRGYWFWFLLKISWYYCPIQHIVQRRWRILILHENKLFWSLRDDNRPHQSVSYGVAKHKHVGSMLGLCWLHVGPCLAHVGPMLGTSWAHVGPMLGHVEPKFGNLSDFRSLEKQWKTQDSREK